jgi:hypothetical protein
VQVLTGAKIVDSFVKCLCDHEGIAVVRSAVSRNVFQISGRVNVLLYVKGRAEAPYRWDVTANVVGRLQQQKIPWFVVLLFESKNTGYLLPSQKVTYFIQNTWPLAGDGDYKPATGSYLDRCRPFSSFNQFLVQLAAQVGEPQGQPDIHRVTGGFIPHSS